MNLVERLREQIRSIRRKSVSLSDIIPLLIESADKIESLTVENLALKIMVSSIERCTCSCKDCVKTGE